MARVRQFANDLGISKNQAQTLINKGRSRKDGGSQILESIMSEKDKKKKNKKQKPQIMPRNIEPTPKSYSLEDLKEMGIDPRTMSKKFSGGGSNVILPKKRPTNLKKKKTSEQIVREINEYDLTKSDITASVDKDFSKRVAKQNEEAKKKVKKSNMKNKGGFPDLTGDGNVTKADILKGRGVKGFARGGGMAIQGLGFKGVR
jgi:hypothetical protein